MMNFVERLKLYREKDREFESIYLRDYFLRRHSVEVGLYSYGCFDQKRIPKNTKIGRYCSFAPTAYIFARNHGVNFMSLHPFLYNSNLGVVDVDTIENGSIEIEDDVWLGHNSIILPSVTKIGRGAVIGAGSIVTKNVEKYSIVGGNPAKHIKYRFPRAVIENIEASKWWLLSKSEFKRFIEENPDYAYGKKYIRE